MLLFLLMFSSQLPTATPQQYRCASYHRRYTHERPNTCVDNAGVKQITTDNAKEDWCQTRLRMLALAWVLPLCLKYYSQFYLENMRIYTRASKFPDLFVTFSLMDKDDMNVSNA